MLRNLRNRVYAGLLTLSLVLLVAIPVYAIADPNYTTIEFAHVYENVFVDGDQVFYIRYDIDYPTDPDEPASDTFLMVLYDTNGSSLLFQRSLNYYGHNLISIYLTPAQALTWSSSYVLRISGNPSIFPVLTEGINLATRTLSAADYTAGSADVSRTTLGAQIILDAQVIKADTSDDWIGDTTERLTSLGALYVNAAIPGLSSVIPGIYETGIATPTLADAYRTSTLVGTISGSFFAGEVVIGGTSTVTGTFISGSQTATEIQVSVTGVTNFVVGETVTGYSSGETVTNITEVVQGALEWSVRSNTGTRLDTALTNFGAWLGISRTATGGIFLFLIFAMTAGYIFSATGQVHGAIMVAFPVLILGNFLGIIPFAVTWLGVMVVVLVFAIIFIMGRLA